MKNIKLALVVAAVLLTSGMASAQNTGFSPPQFRTPVFTRPVFTPTVFAPANFVRPNFQRSDFSTVNFQANRFARPAESPTRGAPVMNPAPAQFRLNASARARALKSSSK